MASPYNNVLNRARVLIKNIEAMSNRIKELEEANRKLRKLEETYKLREEAIVRVYEGMKDASD